MFIKTVEIVHENWEVIQGVEHDLWRIQQIYWRLYNNKDTLGETKLDIEMKVPCYTSI